MHSELVISMVQDYSDEPMTWLQWKSMMGEARTVQLRVPIPLKREHLFTLSHIFAGLNNTLHNAATGTIRTAEALPAARQSLRECQARLKLLQDAWQEDYQELYGEEIERERNSHFKLYEVVRKEDKEGTGG